MSRSASDHERTRDVRGNRSAPEAPLSLRERNKLRTRRELLDAALEVFSEQGFGSATVEAIAARAGASKVTVYSYFPRGREELFQELYEEINTELIERATTLYDEEGGPFARICGLVEIVIDVASRPRIGRFYSIDDPSLDAALDPVRGHASGVFIKLMSEDIEAGRVAGTLRATTEADSIARLLVGAMRAALTETAQHPDRAGDLLAAFADLVRGLVV